MSPGRGAEEQSGAAQQAEGEGEHHPRHRLQLPGGTGLIWAPQFPPVPPREEGDAAGGLSGAVGQEALSSPAHAGTTSTPGEAAGASCCCWFWQGRVWVQAEVLCPRCRVSSLGESGPGSVPEPQVTVVAPRGHGTAHVPRDGVGWAERGIPSSHKNGTSCGHKSS